MHNAKYVAPQANLLKLLERHANLVFGLIICIVSIGLLTLGPNYLPDFTSIFVSVGTSLLASLIFAFMYSNISERYHMMVIRNDLSQAIREEMKEMIYSHRTLLPDDEFPSTSRPTERFNRTLVDSLKKSHTYFFKGVTGRHIASRLIDVKPKNLKCEILLVDPRNEKLLRLYIRERFGPQGSQEEINRLLEKVRTEIYMTVVALFDQAHQLGIDILIGFYICPIFSRIEILEDLALISYFAEKTATNYPATYLYKNESLFYDIIYTDIQQTWSLVTEQITFTNHRTEAELQQFLNNIGCTVTTLSISALRKDAKAFDTDFRRNLKTASS